MFFIFIVALLVSLFSAPGYAVADITRFVDEEGTVHFTDSAVPGKHAVYIKTPKVKFSTKNKNRFSNKIRKASLAHDVDYSLIRSVIEVESNFNPNALSHAGAQGLMQLMPATARRYDVKDAYDPTENINAGTRYLKYLLKKYDGNTKLALAAYNAGETAVATYSGIPPYAETKNFVAKTLNLYGGYSGNNGYSKTVIYSYVDENGTLLLTDTPRNALFYH